MRETGEIVATENGFATVRVSKKTECDKCGMCVFPKGEAHADFRVSDNVGVKKGDKVIFETTENGRLTGAVLVFLIPLLLIGAGIAIGYTVFKEKQELFALIFALGLVAAWFLPLSFIDKAFKKKFGKKMRIVSVLPENSDEPIGNEKIKENTNDRLHGNQE